MLLYNVLLKKASSIGRWGWEKFVSIMSIERGEWV